MCDINTEVLSKKPKYVYKLLAISSSEQTNFYPKREYIQEKALKMGVR